MESWMEIPGRANVLFLSNPIYTHMIEQILRSSSSCNHKPWYFGHLYLEGGSESLKKLEVLLYKK